MKTKENNMLRKIMGLGRGEEERMEREESLPAASLSGHATETVDSAEEEDSGESGDTEHPDMVEVPSGEEYRKRLLSEGIAERIKQLEGKTSADPEEGVRILDGILSATPSNPVATEVYDLIMRGLSYATDIARAYSEGEVAGRNTRIDLLTAQGPEKGDGVSRIKGKPDEWSYDPCGGYAPGSIFDLASLAR